MEHNSWYAAKTGNKAGQGLVIETGTGRNVAVSYDGKDTELLAAAPELLSILRVAVDVLETIDEEIYNKRMHVAFRDALVGKKHVVISARDMFRRIEESQ